MSYRNSDLAIQYKTKARLRLAVKLYPITASEPRDFVGGVTERAITLDELGDRIINEVIAEKYPLVIECEKEMARVEKAMIEKGKKVSEPVPADEASA